MTAVKRCIINSPSSLTSGISAPASTSSETTRRINHFNQTNHDHRTSEQAGAEIYAGLFGERVPNEQRRSSGTTRDKIICSLVFVSVVR